MNSSSCFYLFSLIEHRHPSLLTSQKYKNIRVYTLEEEEDGRSEEEEKEEEEEEEEGTTQKGLCVKEH